MIYLVRNGIAEPRRDGVPLATTVYGHFFAERPSECGPLGPLYDVLRDRARIRAGRHPTPTAAVIDSASVRAAGEVRHHRRLCADGGYADRLVG
jgi:hypothetical protein